MAAVCINDKGPFDFLVDTGAATSAIDEQTAKELQLTTVNSYSGTSFGCHRTAAFTRVTNWSVGGASFPAQAFLVATLHTPVTPALAGLIGSDTLSSFGAIRVDYEDQTLTLGAGSQPRSDVAGGVTSPSLTPALKTGTSHTVTMPVKVLRFSLSPPSAQHVDSVVAVRPTTTVVLSGHSYPFVLDTGAASTIIGPSVAQDGHLIELPLTRRSYAGLACQVTVHTFQLTSWRLVGLSLAPQAVASNAIPPPQDGLLGSGTLQWYNPIVVDYDDGVLLTGNYAGGK